jgi:hypothetical protein
VAMHRLSIKKGILCVSWVYDERDKISYYMVRIKAQVNLRLQVITDVRFIDIMDDFHRIKMHMAKNWEVFLSYSICKK